MTPAGALALVALLGTLRYAPGAALCRAFWFAEVFSAVALFLVFGFRACCWKRLGQGQWRWARSSAGVRWRAREYRHALESDTKLLYKLLGLLFIGVGMSDFDFARWWE